MRVLLTLILAIMLSGCGNGQIREKDEAVRAGWSQVLEQDGIRASLADDLVASVRSDAAHEAEALAALADAHARSSRLKVDPTDPASLANYQRAQEDVAQALDRALRVASGYPELMSDGSFLDLKARLAEAENRATLAHGRYMTLVQDYNMQIRQFPANLTALIFGYEARPNFTLVNQARIQPQPTPILDAPRQRVPAASPPVQTTPGVPGSPQQAKDPAPAGNAPRGEPTE